MKTYPLKSEAGELTGFEVVNNFFSSGSVARFINRVRGCEITWIRKMFSSHEIHLKFTYDNVLFEVWEPYGDNSRLHIGPVETLNIGDKLNAAVIQRLEKEIAVTRNYFI